MWMLTVKACQKVIHNKRSEKDIINPLHPNTSMYILHTVLYFYGADEENLFTDQKLLLLCDKWFRGYIVGRN